MALYREISIASGVHLRLSARHDGTKAIAIASLWFGSQMLIYASSPADRVRITEPDPHDDESSAPEVATIWLGDAAFFDAPLEAEPELRQFIANLSTLAAPAPKADT